MATAEAVEFLTWLHESGNGVLCLQQGEQWPQWASAEGFNPHEILEGLGEIENSSDLVPTFADFVLSPENQHPAFSAWLESILARLATNQTVELSKLSGGAQSKSAFSLQSKLQHREQHLKAELLELKVDVRSNITIENKGWSDQDFEYNGSEVHGSGKIYHHNNGSLSGTGSYYGRNGGFNTVNFETDPSYKNNSYLQINHHFFNGWDVTRKDAGLLSKAASIDAAASHKATSLKDVWNSDLNYWTQQAILQSQKIGKIKSKHLQQFKSAKQILKDLNQVDYRSLSGRKKEEIYAADWDAMRIARSHQAVIDTKTSEASKDLQSKKLQAETSLRNIEWLQEQYSRDKQDYEMAKNPVHSYTSLFGRLRGNTDTTKSYHRIHYRNISDKISTSKSKANDGNYDYGKNWLKTAVHRTAKREELFGKSEALAVKAAVATYKSAVLQGNPKKVCLAMASATYLQTLVNEDLNFLRNKPREEWNSLSGFNKSYLHQQYCNYRRWHSFSGDREIGIFGDVLLSVGADILQRQLEVAEKAYHDQRDRFSALRLELLVSRLTIEYTTADHYQVWYANHPEEFYQPVKKWFAHAWTDIWDTLTLPYRAMKAEIKAWKSGAGFWGGIKAGWDEEGKIFHQDVRGFNKTFKGLERAFDLIPGFKKFFDVFNDLGRALESIPFHIAKNVTSLGKQLWKVVSFQATWGGIYDGIGRDTRGVRHLIRHINWFAHDLFTGNFKNIGEVISRDFDTAEKGAKIYLQRKEIKEALLIKHDELTARRTLHRHFRHLVKSPMRLLAGDIIANLTNDKAFVNFRQNFSASKDGRTYLKASSLYGTSFYKNTEAKVEHRVKTFAGKLHDIVPALQKDLKHQIANLSLKQKDAYIVDYKHNEFPWQKVFAFELNTSQGQALKQKAKVLTKLPGKALQDLGILRHLMQHALIDFQDYVQSRQPGMQKLAQAWAMNGGLLAWAQDVDQSFVKSAKQVCKFLQSAQGVVFKGKALDAFFLYKELHPLKHDVEQRAAELRSDLAVNTAVVDTRKAYIKAVSEYKAYQKEKAYFKRQWDKWGMADGEIALTAYDITFRPQFSINTTTNPPTVTCTPLSSKSSKSVNSNIKSKHMGVKFFMRLMWTQLLSQSISAHTGKALKSDLTRGEFITRSVGKRLEFLTQALVARKPIQALANKSAEFFGSHLVLKDIIVYEDGSKIAAVRVSTELKLQSLSNLVRQVRGLVPIARSRVAKFVRRESDFIKLMNVQVSEFNKTNFKVFEAHPFNNIKLLELQAGLAYDFDDQVDGKKIEPSRYDDMKTTAARRNKQLSADYNSDKQQEAAGADLTIGQALLSVEVSPSSTTPKSMMQQWSALHAASASAKTRSGSGSASGSSSAQVATKPKLSSIWIKLPNQSVSNSSQKSTSNLLLLWRNYKLLKKLTKPKLKDKLVDSGEAEAVDFDTLTSGASDSAKDLVTRRFNREAVRLDDDLDLFKDEVATDEKALEDIVKTEAKVAEKQALNQVDNELLSKEADLPDGENLLKPEDALSGFSNTIIDTATGDATTVVTTQVEAVETAVNSAVESATEIAETTGTDLAEAIVI